MRIKLSTRQTTGIIAALFMVLLSQMGFAADQEFMGCCGIALAGIGDIEVKKITDLITQQGHAFEEFKKANDDRLKAVESKGYAPSDLVEKVDAINTDLTRLSKEIAEAAKKNNRLNIANTDETEDQAEHKAAFNEFLRKGTHGNLADLEKKVFRRGSDVEGGYLISDEMDTSITRVATAVSVIRSLSDVRSIGKESIRMRVKTKGTASRWVGEGESSSQTTGANYSVIEISAEEMEVEPWVYNSAMDDADFDLYQDIVNEAGIGFGEGEAQAFVLGDGVKKPRGFLTYNTVDNTSYEWGKVGYVASGAAGDFAASNPADKIITLQHSLRPVYRNGAVFLMNDTTLAKVRQMKDGTGQYYLFNPDPTGKFLGYILGTPVQIDDFMPSVAANSLSIAYANLNRAYRIVDRSGVSLIRDNITEKGTTKFNFRKRVGGGIKNFEAIKLMKFATT